MFNKMASKTETYLREALDCDVILLATVLNPAYRLSMFQAWFPSHHDHAESLIQEKYEARKSEVDSAAREYSIECLAPIPKKSQGSKHHRLLADVDFFPETNDGPLDDEMTVYLGGKYKLHSSDADQCLDW